MLLLEQGQMPASDCSLCDKNLQEMQTAEPGLSGWIFVKGFGMNINEA